MTNLQLQHKLKREERGGERENDSPSSGYEEYKDV